MNNRLISAEQLRHIQKTRFVYSNFKKKEKGYNTDLQ